MGLGGATQSRTGLLGFAIRCITDLLSRQNTEKKETFASFFEIWSGKRVSNSRPQPWQGCALPTELFPQRNKNFGAGKESRTLDLNLGKVALYQLSYSRLQAAHCSVKTMSRRPVGAIQSDVVT